MGFGVQPLPLGSWDSGRVSVISVTAISCSRPGQGHPSTCGSSLQRCEPALGTFCRILEGFKLLHIQFSILCQCFWRHWYPSLARSSQGKPFSFTAGLFDVHLYGILLDSHVTSGQHPEISVGGYWDTEIRTNFQAPLGPRIPGLVVDDPSCGCSPVSQHLELSTPATDLALVGIVVVCHEGLTPSDLAESKKSYPPPLSYELHWCALNVLRGCQVRAISRFNNNISAKRAS